MLSINDRGWKSFSIKELEFKNYHGKRLTKKDRKMGIVPLLTAGESNQGVSEFISNNWATYKNCFSVDMFGNTFFHNYSCAGDDNIYFFENCNLSNGAKRFIINCVMNANKNKYSYGKQFRQPNADSLKIMLPVSDRDEPDYTFMEAYIEEREEVKRSQYKDYAQEMIDSLGGVCDIPTLSEKKWLEFELICIFDYKRGNQNKMNSLIEGHYPLISAKNTNNGLKGFAQKNGKKVYAGNTISLNNDGDGGVGIAYYQPTEYLLDSHCTCLKPKSEFNKYAMLFICSSIVKQRALFSHGRSISEERLKMMKIELPINENEEPDYGYMEQYIKNMIIKKYKSYINYL